MCDLIEAKGKTAGLHPGVLPILDDVCRTMHARSGNEGLDEKFVETGAQTSISRILCYYLASRVQVTSHCLLGLLPYWQHFQLRLYVVQKSVLLTANFDARPFFSPSRTFLHFPSTLFCVTCFHPLSLANSFLT